MITSVYRTRVVTAIAATLLAVASLVGVGAGPARAAASDVSCPAGTQTVTYNPGLTLQARPTQLSITRSLGTCVSSDPTVTTGTNTASPVLTLSCLTATSASSTTLTVTWSNGKSSAIFLNFEVNNMGGQTVATGTGSVTSGLFEGDSAVVVNTTETLNTLDCVGDGITRVSGTFTLQLTSV